MKPFFKKYIAQLKRTAGFIIPYNTQYRPHSIYRLNFDDVHVNSKKEALVYAIYPKHVTTLSIAEDLLEACAKRGKPVLQVETDYAVVEVPNGRIYADNEGRVAVISKYNRIIDNVSTNLTNPNGTAISFNSFFEQRYFHRPLKLNGVVFSMLSGGDKGNSLSHWFLDVLPRLHLLKESGLYEFIDWFLLPELKHNFQEETLALLGIPKEKRIVANLNPHIKADSIIVSSAPRGNHSLVPTWICEYIRNSFSSLLDSEIDKTVTGSKVYISGGQAAYQVQNESELVSVLERHGCHSVELSEMSFMDKLKLFSKAETVVSATGEGLVNLLWCKQGTKVIELFNENTVGELYADLASKLGLDYNYMICKMAKGQRQSLTVDVAEMAAMLKEKKEVNRPREACGYKFEV